MSTESATDLRQSSDVKFCSDCGAPVMVCVPAGDNLPRAVCSRCNVIHYQNPRIVVGCVPEWRGRILLCQRAIDPRRGYWTIPAGFLENGETLQAAAARECLEEAEAQVEIGGMLAITHAMPTQVHIIFRARLVDGHFGAGPESLRSELFDEQDVPWRELAFPAVAFTIDCLFSDRRRGLDALHFDNPSESNGWERTLTMLWEHRREEVLKHQAER